MNKDFKALFTEFPDISTQEWKDKIVKDLKGRDYNTLINKTDLGLNFEPFYREENLQEIPFVDNIPGEFPFVRSTKQDNDWNIRQIIVVTDINNANKQAVKLLQTGVNSLIFCFMEDKLSSVSDLSDLLQNIDITAIEVGFNYKPNAFKIQKLYIQYIEQNNIDINKISGSFNFNPFGKVLMTGTPAENEKLPKLNEFVNTNAEKLGNFGAITIGAVMYSNAGANTIQEIAFALSQAVEYINKFTDNEPNDIEKLLKRMEFTFATSGDYFIEIAKYRAIRYLWAKIVKEFGVNNTELQKIKMNAINTNWNKTVYDAHVNMLRVTTETMSAAIGGVYSISVSPFDTTYKMPDEFSYRIAKNTQIILKEESYFDKIVDPAGGSYYIEKLTKDISEKAWELFLELEKSGGFYSNIKNNTIQNMIEESANAKDIKIAQGKITLLGTNKYPNQDETASDKIKFNKPEFKSTSDIKVLQKYRGAEAFEQLRLKTEKANKIPKVFLYNTGNVVMSKARAMFASGFFACAGFEIIESELSLNINNGLAEIQKQNPDIIVVCSSDEEYADVVPQIKAKLNKNIKLVVAGYPKKLINKFNEIGVTEFIHVKSNILETLTKFQMEILK